MELITKAQFEEILEVIQVENIEREEMGLELYVVTGHSYGGLSTEDTLTEYFVAGSMFAFKQGENYYSNGL